MRRTEGESRLGWICGLRSGLVTEAEAREGCALGSRGRGSFAGLASERVVEGGRTESTRRGSEVEASLSNTAAAAATAERESRSIALAGLAGLAGAGVGSREALALGLAKSETSRLSRRSSKIGSGVREVGGRETTKCIGGLLLLVCAASRGRASRASADVLDSVL